MDYQKAARFEADLDEAIARQLGDNPHRGDPFTAVCLLYIAKAIFCLAEIVGHQLGQLAPE